MVRLSKILLAVLTGLYTIIAFGTDSLLTAISMVGVAFATWFIYLLWTR